MDVFYRDYFPLLKESETYPTFQEHLNVQAIKLTNEFKYISPENGPSYIQCSSISLNKGKFFIKNAILRNQIILTGFSSLICIDCVFNCDNEKQKSFIELTNKSYAAFLNCTFNGNIDNCILASDHSKLYFDKCRFNSNSNAHITVSRYSSLVLVRSYFSNAKKVSIYVKILSYLKVYSSEFVNMDAKAIYCDPSVRLSIKFCRFYKISKGAIAVSNSCFLRIKNCKFEEISSSSIRASNDTIFLVSQCEFINGNGNCFKIENSTGTFTNSKITNFKFPSIAIFGINSNPFISNIDLSECSPFSIVVRDAACPIFNNLKINSIDTAAFSISDFSKVILKNTYIKNENNKDNIILFNGSLLIIDNCNILENSIIKKYNSYYYYYKQSNEFNKIPNYDLEKLPNRYRISQLCNEYIDTSAKIDFPKPFLNIHDLFPFSDYIYSYKFETIKKIYPLFQPKQTISLIYLHFSLALNIELIQENKNCIFTCSCGHKHNGIDDSKCSICSTTINNKIPLKFVEKCRCCKIRNADTILFDCGHMMCYICASTTSIKSSECYECRKQFHTFKYLFPKKSPLHYIIEKLDINEDQKIIELEKSLQSSCFIDEIDEDTLNTPLLLSIIKNHFEISLFLIKKGSDVHIINNNKQLALDLFINLNYLKGIEFILYYGYSKNEEYKEKLMNKFKELNLTEDKLIKFIEISIENNHFELFDILFNNIKINLDYNYLLKVLDLGYFEIFQLIYQKIQIDDKILKSKILEIFPKIDNNNEYFKIIDFILKKNDSINFSKLENNNENKEFKKVHSSSPDKEILKDLIYQFILDSPYTQKLISFKKKINDGFYKIVENYDFTLFEYIKKNNLFKHKIVNDLLKCIKFIHSLDFIHRDIRPHNIYLKINNNDIKVVLGDFFDISPTKNFDQDKSYSKDSEKYQIKNESKDKSTDIYSLGITLKEIYLNENIPEELINLINKCSSNNKNERPNIDQIIKDFQKIFLIENDDFINYTESNYSKIQKLMNIENYIDFYIKKII